MTTNHDLPAYESGREWALHPWLPRPPGVAHLLRGGVITWVRMSSLLPRIASPAAGSPDSAGPVAPPLLILLATMLVEVTEC